MQREPSDSSSGSASKTIRRIGSRIARFGSKKDDKERERDREREVSISSGFPLHREEEGGRGGEK
jgi:hypothetical protein